MLAVQCPACHETWEEPASNAGKTVACPKCRMRVQIGQTCTPPPRLIHQFSGPLRVKKGLNDLLGLLPGIAADKTITEQEAKLVEGWLAEYRDLAGRHPMSELVPIVQTALADGRLQEQEVLDIRWCCEQLIGCAQGESEEAMQKADMQCIQAFIRGIAADRVITEPELAGLNEWLDGCKGLAGVWPYNDLSALIARVVLDGFIDEAEHAELLAFFDTFGDRRHPAKTAGPIFSENPKIEFPGRLFCFTGESAICPREDLEGLVVSLGGGVHGSVRKGVDFLVVGGEGSDLWAFHAYGRKIERAIELRQQHGAPAIVAEPAFWAAVPSERRLGNTGVAP